MRKRRWHFKVNTSGYYACIEDNYYLAILQAENLFGEGNVEFQFSEELYGYW